MSGTHSETTIPSKNMPASSVAVMHDAAATPGAPIGANTVDGSGTQSQAPARLDLRQALASRAFPVCMALLMSYGMELYNHLLMGAGMSVQTLLSPLGELLPMALIVVAVERLLGGRIVSWLMSRIGDPQALRIPYGIVLGTVTCIVMCPMMSMVATLAFKHPTAATLGTLWLGTFLRNLPFALAWALVVARPISGAVVERLARA